MAARPITRQWVIPATGKATLREIINNADHRWVVYATIRANASNSSDITWADIDGEVGGYLEAGEAALLGDDWGHVDLLDFTFTGTPDDVLYLTIGISAS